MHKIRDEPIPEFLDNDYGTETTEVVSILHDTDS